MIPTRHKKSRFGAILGLGMLLMLAVQVLEAGHVHNMASQSPDCVYCQVGGLVAIVSSGAELLVAATVALITVAYITDAPLVRTALPTARGPPLFSN